MLTLISSKMTSRVGSSTHFPLCMRVLTTGSLPGTPLPAQCGIASAKASSNCINNNHKLNQIIINLNTFGRKPFLRICDVNFYIY